MIHFFGEVKKTVFTVQTSTPLSKLDIQKLEWLFGNQSKIEESVITDFFIGPRATMITPWSTNAVEIAQNMGVNGILRIEEFFHTNENSSDFDPMLFQKYSMLSQHIFTVNIQPQEVLEIENIDAYNQTEGLALNDDQYQKVLLNKSLDLINSMNSKQIEIKEYSTLDITVSVTNVYSRKNIFYVDRVTTEKVYQLPFLPSLGISWKF